MTKQPQQIFLFIVVILAQCLTHGKPSVNICPVNKGIDKEKQRGLGDQKRESCQLFQIWGILPIAGGCHLLCTRKQHFFSLTSLPGSPDYKAAVCYFVAVGEGVELPCVY